MTLEGFIQEINLFYCYQLFFPQNTMLRRSLAKRKKFLDVISVLHDFGPEICMKLRL
ncbi:mCG1044607 [Mus musculus]|nr:mCG1044607 [Mus musculus]